MIKLFSNRAVIPVVSIIFILFLPNQYRTYGAVADTNDNAANEIREAAKPSGPVIVGRIGDYSISDSELRARLLSELEPDPYRMYTDQARPFDANSMLLQMLGEKAIVMDARKQGLLEEKAIRKAVNSYREKQMVSLWVKDNVQKSRDKIDATENEIDQQLKANSKMNRQQAKAAIETAKANSLLDGLYEEVSKESNVKKVPENFSEAAKLYDRLLNHPKKPQTEKFVRAQQIEDDLTEDERNIALATFSHGKITVEDWFETLCQYAPPSRPDNLNTAKGVEQLLDKALVTPVIVSNVQLSGLDKDPDFQKRIRDYEDNILLNSVKKERYANAKEPNEAEIVAFYHENRDYFIRDRVLKIDQIWCKDLETAGKVKAEIISGKNFEEAKKEYSLYPGGQAYNASPGTEGFFWNEIRAAEPDEIIGPVKGYRSDGIKWRIVKILEKKAGQSVEYSSQLENAIKFYIMQSLGDKNIADYCLETLRKYPYEVYPDRIKDIDPMNIR